jgi:hypothetical protein
VTGVMTGPWLLVKWAGIAVLLCYLVLSAVVCWRRRRKSSRLPYGLIGPLIVGNVVAFSLPWIFEDVVFARICFVGAQAVYLYGLLILIKEWRSNNGWFSQELEN